MKSLQSFDNMLRPNLVLVLCLLFFVVETLENIFSSVIFSYHNRGKCVQSSKEIQATSLVICATHCVRGTYVYNSRKNGATFHFICTIAVLFINKHPRVNTSCENTSIFHYKSFFCLLRSRMYGCSV